MNVCKESFMDGITCKVLVEPITSLLLPVVWNDVMVSCLSGCFTHSSKENTQQDIVID